MISLRSDEVQEVTIPFIPVPVKEVLRRLGYPPDVPKEKITVQQMLDDCISRAGNLFKPKGVFKSLEIQCKKDNRVTFSGTDFIIESYQVSHLLDDCPKAIVFMVTIGDDLEKEMKTKMDSGKMTEGVILDAIGSETADAVADWVHRSFIKFLAEKEGLDVTARFSPGYGDWPVTVQSEILKLCEGERIGISVNASSLMAPQKSVSAVFGLRIK